VSKAQRTTVAYLANHLPELDDEAHFLFWLMQWQIVYLKERGNTFEDLYTRKWLWLAFRLGKKAQRPKTHKPRKP
jgi:hypothetical protein